MSDTLNDKEMMKYFNELPLINLSQWIETHVSLENYSGLVEDAKKIYNQRKEYVLTDHDVKRLGELGQAILGGLSCNANGDNFPCRTDRLDAVKHMKEYLDIHNCCEKEIATEVLEKMAKDEDFLLSTNLINFARRVQNYLKKTN